MKRCTIKVQILCFVIFLRNNKAADYVFTVFASPCKRAPGRGTGDHFSTFEDHSGVMRKVLAYESIFGIRASKLSSAAI